MPAHPFYPFPPHETVTTTTTTTTFSFIGRRFHGIGLFITMSVETSDLLRLMNKFCSTWEGNKTEAIKWDTFFGGNNQKSGNKKVG